MGEGTGRVRLMSVAAIAVAVFCYVFVFAEPLYPELSTQARWSLDLQSAGAAVASDGAAVGGATHPDAASGSDARLLSFTLGDAYGYLRPSGSVARLERAGAGHRLAAVSDERYAVPRASQAFMLARPDGSELGRLEATSPFFAGGRLFSAEGDGTALAAFDEQGRRLWTYSFPCHVSAFSAGEGLAVGGTVDGWLEGIGNDGRRAFLFAPGGSRAQVVLGVGVSPSGTFIAAVTGIDRQRLVVLGKGGADYRVTSHRYLESDYREPVRVVVLPDDMHVLYRRADGIGVYSVDGSVDEVLPVKADDFDVELDEGAGIAYVCARRGGKAEVAAFRLPATLLGRVALPDGCEYVRLDGASVYFGRGSTLGRFDFMEE